MITRDIAAWDGLRVRVVEWGGGDRVPLLCLPGLVRTSGDFAGMAARHGAERRVVSLDYVGRGRSAWARSVARYAPEAMLRDVMDVCAAMHLHRAVVLGTSFGGLLAMALGAARPGLLAGVVLNDVGPEIGREGAGRVRRFVGDDPALPDLGAVVAHLRRMLPDLSLQGPGDWSSFAALTYAPGADDRWHPQWDTRIARMLGTKLPDLWPLFRALSQVPLLLVHGGRSTLLLAETVARMRAARPDMAVATVPESGHAPTLAEPAAVAALENFLAADQLG
jgi:pimeloyl-ACP methyl ester carboxylesterase